MQFRTVHALAAAALTAFAGSAGASPDAADILKKSEAAMKTAKTYAANMEMAMDMGQMGSGKINMDVKVITGQKMMVKMSPIGTPTGAMAMTAATMNVTVVDDGKYMWTYLPGMKQYNKAPSQAKTANAASISMKNTKGLNFKYVKEENFEGKPCHVLQGTSNSQRGTQTTTMYIDKSNYRFKGLTMNQKATGPGGQSMEMKMTMVVKSEQVNVNLPASLFTFTPPAGATEAKGGMRPGGLLGGPGGGR